MRLNGIDAVTIVHDVIFPHRYPQYFASCTMVQTQALNDTYIKSPHAKSPDPTSNTEIP